MILRVGDPSTLGRIDSRSIFQYDIDIVSISYQYAISRIEAEPAPTWRKKKLPDREKDCIEYKLHPLAYKLAHKLAPVVTKFEWFKLKGGKDDMLCGKDGLSIKRCDGFGFDTLSLGQLVDSVGFISLAF